MRSGSPWNARLAKLLIVMLLLQSFLLLPGGAVAAAQATETAGHAVGETNGQDIAAVVSAKSEVRTSAVQAHIRDYEWERISTNVFVPDPRNNAMMAYDEEHEKVVLFGGQGNTSLLNDTWIWDGFEQTWQEVTNPGTTPTARKNAAIAYDPINKKLLMFGGEGTGRSLNNQTWLWNGATATWEQATVAGTVPSARAGARLSYDGNQLVLFGGHTYSGSNKIPLGDTWLWDGTEWSQMFPATSPPPSYDGQMIYNGETALLYGGNIGPVTEDFGGTSFTFNGSSPYLWKWNRDTTSWEQANGPLGYGRWGHAIAYDGDRVVIFSGQRDYVHATNTLIRNLSLPTSTYPGINRDALVYGLKGLTWESFDLVGTTTGIFQSLGDYGPSDGIITIDNQFRPYPLAYPSMVFDGKNFVLFGGERDSIGVYNFPASVQNPHNAKVYDWPAGNVNETWTFGYNPPTEPDVRMDFDPILNLDPERINDTVSVITNVRDNGNRTIHSRGVEYRPYTEEDAEEEPADWIDVPYTGTVVQDIGAFTVMLTGLSWHQEYEVRGYAANEIGKSYTEPRRFIMDNDTNLEPPDIVYDRVGASVLHVKDRQRLVAIGDGVINLLRKPLNGINYHLRGSNEDDPTIYPLTYNVLNDRQLELAWSGELPPGLYDIVLDHEFYTDYIFPEGLLLTALDFYKPRNFGRIEVASTSGDNEVGKLVLQGPFTEEPTSPNVYVLNDFDEVVAINDTILFKGSSLVVDKSNSAGPAVINGNGRLYVSAGSTLGDGISYTLHEGPFTISSDNFALALGDSEATDYLNMDMPIKAVEMTFVPGGLRLGGELEIGFKAGSQTINDTVAIEDLRFTGKRFELTGTYKMNRNVALEPFSLSNTEFALDSRIPYMAVRGTGSLPGTSVSFDMYLKTKQGRLDGISFGMYNKNKLASTGLQVNYLYGNIDNLAGKTTLPQTFKTSGSVQDVIVPQLKHPQVNYKFNLLGTDTIDIELTPYGFNATGTEYYYWLAVNQMNLQAVVNPAKAGIKGFNTQGFGAKGDINVFDVIRGTINAYNFNKLGFAGIIQGTVNVPKGIPRIGGATVRNVVLTTSPTGLVGMFKHNGIAARVSYTFSNNTILFEVEAEPPKKSWWEKGLGFLDKVNEFMEKAEPWLDLLEEVLTFDSQGSGMVRIASAGELKRVFDWKPIQIAFQPEDTVKFDVQAKISEGWLTTIEATPPMTMEARAASGKSIFQFEVDRAFEALLALAGEQTLAVPRKQAAGGQYSGAAPSSQVYYDEEADLTFVRVALEPGTWGIEADADSNIIINELLYANRSQSLEEAAQVWLQTPERPVAALTVPTRGVYVLELESAFDPIVYKPDGRPYNLQTAQEEPDWNAYRGDDGKLYVRLHAVEAGTWLISAGGSLSSAVLSSISAGAAIGDIAQWAQAGTYPVEFQLRQTANGQAIVEIYGANNQTKLYKPDGERYLLQFNPNLPFFNAILDEAQQKLTVLVNGVEQNRTWKATSDSFVSVAAFESSRRLPTLKPLLADGRFSKYVELPDAGDYMLAIIGGDADTAVLDPAGKPHELIFDGPDANAYLQPAADRVPDNSVGDPLEQPNIGGLNPAAAEGKDVLYVSLIEAPGGQWTVQNTFRFDIEIQKLLPLPSIAASVETVGGADNRIRVTWSMENTSADAEVMIMLTGNADDLIGDLIADIQPASGSLIIDIPPNTMPGTYHLSVAGIAAGDPPVYGTAENVVVVTAPYALEAPEQPEIISTGNGEVSLRFASLAEEVTAYRVWVQAHNIDDSGQALPVGDFAPQPGNEQFVVLSGLEVGQTYTLNISAIGEMEGRIVISPHSAGVTAELPAPDPAALSVTLDAGDHIVVEQSYTDYDGTEETLLLTSADQVELAFTSDQDVTVTLSVNGETVGSLYAAAGDTQAFALHELLETASLKERVYTLLLEAVNERGDLALIYRKLAIDRTAPLLFVSGGEDEAGEPLALNGTITGDSKLYIVGQTEVGARLDVNGTKVPLDDSGHFVYYMPLEWGTNAGQMQVVITAADAVGNSTQYGFEVLLDSGSAPQAYPGELAALTVGGATMAAPYQFGQQAYSAAAYERTVRIYAVPLEDGSVVTINGIPLTSSGYVEVDVTDATMTVPIQVQTGSAPAKQFSLQIAGSGSDAAALASLALHNASSAGEGEQLAAPVFTGLEEIFEVFVGHEADRITLTPNALMPGSSITVNTQPVANGEASQTIELATGENLIDVAVVSPSGSESRLYQIMIWREHSDNARLSQLDVQADDASLLTGFNPDKAKYQVLVPYEADTVTILTETEQADASVLVDGQAAASGTSQLIPFTEQAASIDVEVTAQDGATLRYTVNLLRQQATPNRPPLLSSLEASSVLKERFDPYQLSYETLRPLAGSQVQLTAVAADPEAIVTVDGVSRTGGGEFRAFLQLGLNTVIVSVEAGDGTASQTYSVDVERVNQPGAVITRPAAVSGGAGDWSDQVEIIRYFMGTTAIDRMNLTSWKAREIVQQSLRNDDPVVSIQLSDLVDRPADEWIVSLGNDVVKLFAEAGMEIHITLPQAKLVISADLLRYLEQESKDAYFRVIPIRNAQERKDVESRVQDAELVISAAGDQAVSVIGTPVQIETNYTGYTTELEFPLTDWSRSVTPDAIEALLSQLAVYIEHSDGDKALQRGEIRYDEQGNPVSIVIKIDKFSTFTLIQIGGEDAQRILPPYLSGYNDGTFRPAQPITRAELATILFRLGAHASVNGSQAGQSAGFPDVAATYWANEAILAMQRSGLMLGDDVGNFRPGDIVTRGEMATLAARLLGPSAGDGLIGDDYADTAGHWAQSAINRATQAGIMRGYGDGTFGPGNSLSRAEAVTVLNRLFRRPSIETTTPSWPDVPLTHWAIREIESASGTLKLRLDGGADLVSEE